MKKSILAFFVFAIGICTSKAQINYHDIAPDTIVSAWDAFQIRPSTVTSNDVTIWWHPTPEVVVQTHGNCEILFDGSSLPSKLEMDDTITASGNWNVGTYNALSSGTSGNWRIHADDKYLGFRFKNAASSSWYYGWLLMSVGTGASSFTVSEWAYNAVAGQPIKAGQADVTGIVGAKRAAVKISTSGNRVQFSGLASHAQHHITISDINGRTIETVNIGQNETLDISRYSKGIYIISLAADGFVYNFKVPVL